jgi:cell division protein FtsL
MNTAIRVLTAGYITPNFKPLQITIGLGTLVLLFVLVLSALSLVYVKDLHRRLFIQYQELEEIHRGKLIQQNNLLLERSAWSAEARIQHIAKNKLAMNMPAVIQRVKIR